MKGISMKNAHPSAKNTSLTASVEAWLPISCSAYSNAPATRA
jgi:hypothetical protein